MAGTAIETTAPSMKPMLEARIAVISTKRRRSAGQKVVAVAGAADASSIKAH
jgi:hypothetical protein